MFAFAFSLLFVQLAIPFFNFGNRWQFWKNIFLDGLSDIYFVTGIVAGSYPHFICLLASQLKF
jgi:hypothetical protein